MTGDRDDIAVQALAQRIYVKYCDTKGFKPHRNWVPRWAVEYSEVAVDTFGYDDETLDEVLAEMRQEVTA